MGSFLGDSHKLDVDIRLRHNKAKDLSVAIGSQYGDGLPVDLQLQRAFGGDPGGDLQYGACRQTGDIPGCRGAEVVGKDVVAALADGHIVVAVAQLPVQLHGAAVNAAVYGDALLAGAGVDDAFVEAVRRGAGVNIADDRVRNQLDIGIVRKIRAAQGAAFPVDADSIRLQGAVLRQGLVCYAGEAMIAGKGIIFGYRGEGLLGKKPNIMVLSYK